MAKEWFPDGVSIPTTDFTDNLNRTIELLTKREVLFEAGIICNLPNGDVYSRADILVPVENDMWDIIEVKSGTSVKDDNIDDGSFQKFCYESAGLKIRNCFLMDLVLTN